MKLNNLLKSVLFMSVLISVASCGSEPTLEPTVQPTQQPTEEPTAEPTVEPTVEPSEDNRTESEKTTAVFEGMTCEYDGTVKSLAVEGLPEDAKVTYVGNDQTEPGKYNIRAKVEFADGSKKNFSAQLIITKCQSVVTAEEIQ